MKGRILHQKYVLSFTSSVKIEIGTQTMVINISVGSKDPFVFNANYLDTFNPFHYRCKRTTRRRLALYSLALRVCDKCLFLFQET